MSAAKVSEYRLTARNGRHIRVATMVTLADGRVIRFLDKLGKAEAVRQAENLIRKGY
jgi:hypothetical protein